MEIAKRMIYSIRKMNSNHIFEGIYVLFVILITSLLWVLGTMNVVPYHSGLIALVIISSISLLLLNDFKYFIPCGIAFVFANPDGYKSDELPLPMIICGFIMIGVLIFFTIINHKKFTFKNKDKSYFALIYFAVFSFLPLTYHNLITPEVKTLVFVYFSYLLYIGVYLFFLGNMDEKSQSITFKACEMIALICAIQCIAKVSIMHVEDPSKPLLSMVYYLGWGLCNEAGILMCFGLPFIFMRTKKLDKWYQFLDFSIELTIVIVGMFFTTSRGTYLFGAISLVGLTLYVFFAHKRKLYFTLSVVLTLLMLTLIIQFTFGFPKFIDEVIHEVFNLGLSSNGRIALYDTAVKLWRATPLTMFFGNGWVAERVITWTQYGMQDGYMVYHSTFFEILSCFGTIGLFVMIYHFYEKYHQLIKLDRFDVGLFAIGYVAVDLYGMVDNTYNYYYYMIPLVILMASFDALGKKEEELSNAVESDSVKLIEEL